jgi:Na+-transporting NADH:ubiquinone oxidoreductase subunit NqrC
MENYEKDHFKAMLKKSKKKESTISILKSYFKKQNDQKTSDLDGGEFGFTGGNVESKVFSQNQVNEGIELPIQQSTAQNIQQYLSCDSFV